MGSSKPPHRQLRFRQDSNHKVWFMASLFLAWDFTCLDTLAPSHINRAILGPEIVASDTETLKSAYFDAFRSNCDWDFRCFWRRSGQIHVRIRSANNYRTTQDSRSASFLFQRLSVTMQTGNAACVLGFIFRQFFFDIVFIVRCHPMFRLRTLRRKFVLILGRQTQSM